MKIKSNKRSRKKIVLFSVVSLILVAGLYTAVAVTNDLWPFSSQDEADTSQDTSSDDQSTSAPGGTDEDAVPDEQPEETIPPNQDSDEGSDRSSARIHIPSHQASDGTILVNVAINETWSDGRCTMRITGPRSQTVRADVFAQAQISGCQPRIDNLPPGSYQVAVYAERDGQRTNTETLNVEL